LLPRKDKQLPRHLKRRVDQQLMNRISSYFVQPKWKSADNPPLTKKNSFGRENYQEHS
jgi:hypothetical protein